MGADILAYPPVIRDVLQRFHDHLGKLGPSRSSNYPDWLKILMVGHWVVEFCANQGADVEDEILEALDRWSAQADNHDADALRAKWDTFANGREDGVTLGTLIHWAREDEAAGLSPIPEEQQGVKEPPFRLASAQETADWMEKLKGYAPKPPPKSKPPEYIDTVIARAVASIGGVEAGRWPYGPPADPVVWTVRINKRDGTKEFRPFTKDEFGRWVPKGPSGLCPPYRRDELHDAAHVYLVEGEKCSDCLRELGLTATTSIGGAMSPTKTDWSALSGKTVTLIADCDKAGEDYVLKVQQLLAKLQSPPKVKVLRLPGLSDGEDVFDFIERRKQEGKSPADIRAEIEAMSAAAEIVKPASRRLKTICMADVVQEKTDWLWQDRIPRGEVTIFVGKGGVGKGWLIAYIVGCITTGMPWMDASPCPKGSVLLVCAEDDPAKVLSAKLTAHSADLSQVHFALVVEDGKGGERMFTLADLEPLKRTLAETPGIIAVVIDPFGSFIDSKVDSHRDNEIREVLGGLVRLAHESNIAVLLVCHSPKGAGKAADEQVLGSVGLPNISRSVLHLVRDSADDSRRLLLHGKSNLSKQAPAWGFCIEGDPPKIEWDKTPTPTTADEWYAKHNGKTDTRAEQTSEAIRVALEDGQWHAKDEVIARVRHLVDHLVSETTIWRAAKNFVEFDRVGFQGKAAWRLKPA